MGDPRAEAHIISVDYHRPLSPVPPSTDAHDADPHAARRRRSLACLAAACARRARHPARGPVDRVRTLRLRAHRALRRSHRAVRRLREGVSGRRALHRLRHHAGRPPDAGAGRLAHRRAHARGRARARACPCVLCRAASTPARSTARTRASWRCATCSTASAAKGALDKQVLVFVPVFNVDGHERFGAGTARTSAAPRRWAGAPPRRTSTSTATT